MLQLVLMEGSFAKPFPELNDRDFGGPIFRITCNGTKLMHTMLGNGVARDDILETG